jgi:hypothetical protein
MSAAVFREALAQRRVVEHPLDRLDERVEIL